MKSHKNKLKKILKSLFPVSYIVPILLGAYLLHIKTNLLLLSLIFLIPGIYALSFAIVYKEIEYRGGTYRDSKAIIMSVTSFWLFFLLGLPALLIFFGFSNYYKSWWTLILTALIAFGPFIIVSLIDKKDKKTISQMNYWIQTPDFNVTKGENALTLKEAQDLISNYQWEKELFRKKRLEQIKKETCPPTIGLDYQGQIFSISSQVKNIFDLHIDTGKDRRDFKGLKPNELFELMEYYYNKEYEKIFKYIR
ncbi:hypothetical protein HYX02_03340 [Candidatus Woesearchaeota archaeon]|nr:hypothetical protein [Candidatus Woesearchaeota archaeon]